MKTVLLCITTMPCEIGASIMAEEFGLVKSRHPMTISQAKDNQYIQSLIDGERHVTMLGTYWNILELSELNPRIQFVVMCPGTVDESTVTDNVQLICDVGPCEYFIKQSEVNTYFGEIRELARILDDRFYNKNIIETQEFYSGLYNFPKEITSTEEKYRMLIKGELKINTLKIAGKEIAESQVTMAQERIKTAIEFELNDGTKVMLVEAQDLIILTHDALHKAFPQYHVTVTVALKFNENCKAYSLRSWVEQFDVGEYARKNGGDGTKYSAGYRVKLN